jgi:arabinan endo-1,5-alpha-L-arabinosidase
MKKFPHHRSENLPPRKPLLNNTNLHYSAAVLLALFMLQESVVPQATTPPTAPATAPPRIPRTVTMPNVPVHDPVMIKQGDTYYMFATGNGISVASSQDLKTWQFLRPVFAQPPEWAVKAIPGFRGHIWAPDIAFHNGRYYLYYSVSAFAKNTSAMGVAVNKTLDPNSPDFKWEDMGKIIQSVPNRDMWNAIDPNLIVDEAGTPWLTFGSFWGGMKLVKLNPDLISVAEPQEWHTISRRPRSFSRLDTDPGDAAVEAPFIFKRGKYYYLFVSFDYCCRGERSDYKVAVGRSEKVTGPYLDKDSKRLDQNGGTIIAQGDKDWHGVGHTSTYTFEGKDYLISHGYDARDRGRSKLRIDELQWDDQDWPSLAPRPAS